MDPINLTAKENEVPVIRFLVLDKLISLPVTGRRIIMFKVGIKRAMGIVRASDMEKMVPENIDELKGMEVIDEILRDCPETKSLAGTLSLPVCNAIIAQLQEIMFGETTAAADGGDVKKK